MASLRCEDLIPLVMEAAPPRLQWMTREALARALERHEPRLPWLVYWPAANTFVWAPTSRAAMAHVIANRYSPLGVGEVWNIGRVIEEIVDGLDVGSGTD